MVKPVTRLMTVEEYLQTEPEREVHHEFVHGRINAMVSSAFIHILVN
jgi:Uma2 family endonuclease